VGRVGEERVADFPAGFVEGVASALESEIPPWVSSACLRQYRDALLVSVPDRGSSAVPHGIPFIRLWEFRALGSPDPGEFASYAALELERPWGEVVGAWARLATASLSPLGPVKVSVAHRSGVGYELHGTAGRASFTLADHLWSPIVEETELGLSARVGGRRVEAGILLSRFAGLRAPWLVGAVARTFRGLMRLAEDPDFYPGRRLVLTNVYGGLQILFRRGAGSYLPVTEVSVQELASGDF